MNDFDSAFQNASNSDGSSLIAIGLFVCVGAFFFGALFTAVRRGIKEEGWFSFKKNEEE